LIFDVLPFERLLKGFFFQEEEVRRVMGYYKTALERYRDPEDAEDDEATGIMGFPVS